jgi:hypothetical protein
LFHGRPAALYDANSSTFYRVLHLLHLFWPFPQIGLRFLNASSPPS